MELLQKRREVKPSIPFAIAPIKLVVPICSCFIITTPVICYAPCSSGIPRSGYAMRPVEETITAEGATMCAQWNRFHLLRWWDEAVVVTSKYSIDIVSMPLLFWSQVPQCTFDDIGQREDHAEACFGAEGRFFC